MSWEREIAELRRREELARRMGGAEKVRRQHEAGKLTVRERIDRLLDPGSFHEIGATAGKAVYGEDGQLLELTPANFVFGRGRVEGRTVVVAGDDFTVRGGAADASIWLKQVTAEQMAGELRLPLFRLIDGTGGGGSVRMLETEGRTYVPANPGWDHVVRNLGLVPVVALGLGPVAGLGAARLVSSHYSVMVQGLSQMFIAGPPVVARIGEKLTKEELGGAAIHARSGAVDEVVESEEEAFKKARRFLSYLPSSVFELAPRGPTTDAPDRRDEWLIEAVPRDRRKVYDMRRVIRAIVDVESFFEMGRKFGSPAITGFARLDGWPVAVLASDPHFYGGAWTAHSAAPGRRIRRRRSRGSSTSPAPSISRSCTSSTCRDSSSVSRPRRRAPSATARGLSPPSTRRTCPGARCSSARRSASPARGTRITRASTTASPGPRETGAPCRSKEASRPPIAPSSRRRRIDRSCMRRSRSGSTACARRSASPTTSASRR